MKYIAGLLLFGILAIIQSTMVSNMPLLNGTADLILLFASLYSALPFGAYIVAYLICVGIALLLKRRIWKMPFLAMLAATFTGTLVVQVISLAARFVTGVTLPVLEVLNLILLPSLLLNLILAIPIFSIMHDISGWMYPEELEV
jgi:hypothetical protein